MDKEAIKMLFRGFGRRASQVGKGKVKMSKSFSKGIDVGAKSRALKGYKLQASKGGVESFISYLPVMAAEKVFGKQKVRNAMWKAVSKPALIADTAAGNVLKKIPGGKNIFTANERIPWDNKGEFYRKVRRSSAMAPIVSARNIATPIIVGVAFEKGINRAMNYAKPKSEPLIKSALAEKLADKVLRKKAASVMIQLHSENRGHEKRAQALRLLYKQAELGLSEFPSNHSELQEKLGELVNQDLVVFEKALELSGGQTKLGELGSIVDPQARNADEKFQADLMNSDSF